MASWYSTKGRMSKERRKFLSAAQRSVLSSLLTNLAAGWIGAIAIIPNFSDTFSFKGIFTLTFDTLAASISLIIAIWLETQHYEKYRRPRS